MLSTCNSTCVGSLTLTPTTQCNIYQRSEIPVRLVLATCDTAFPSGLYNDTLHAAAVYALFAAGVLSATPELSDVQWSDPTTTKKNFLSRSRPSKTIVTGRQMTAKDYTAVDEDSAGASSPFEDRLFYKNLVQHKACKIRGYVTDAGKIYLFLDDKGEFCAYDINFWTGWDNEIEGKSYEFKNYMIDFVGDPMKNVTVPYLDIVATSSQATLGWLYQPL